MSKNLVQFNELQAGITALVAPIKTLKVTDFPTSAQAIEAAKQVKAYLKQVDDKRRELVDPLNAEVRRINDYVKQITGPLLEAETTIKRECVAFEMEQERIRIEAQRKLDEERRQREAELARQQEEERKKAEAAAADGSAEIMALFGEEHAAPDPAALEAKHVEEQATFTNEMSQRQGDIDDNGLKNVRKTWKCEVSDISQVPKEYLVITLNEKMVLAAARGGNTKIPGVRLWQETSLAIGRNTYVPKSALNGSLNGK